MNDVEIHAGGVPKTSASFLSFDEEYCILVCDKCSIGLPMQWAPNHLWDKHGVRRTENEICEELEIDLMPLGVGDAKHWLMDVSIPRPVNNISTSRGFRCLRCPYASRTINVMRNHFSKNHRGLICSEHVEKAKVQLIFKGMCTVIYSTDLIGPLHKYVSIEECPKWKLMRKIQTPRSKGGKPSTMKSKAVLQMIITIPTLDE
jgi:Orsellinic acid/F9775 biosynthesis cluster protein D